MQERVQLNKIYGNVCAPASKSMMQRAVATALLAKGTSRLFNPSFSDDSLSAIANAEKLGAHIERSDEYVLIKGGFNPNEQILDVGESGLGIRMFTPIAALHDDSMTLCGVGSLKSRSMSMISGPLASLGVKVETDNGLLPVKVKGPLIGGEAHVDGSISSQLLTGLLIALPLAKKDSCLYVNDLKSKPYIDMTIEIMKSFGVEVVNDKYCIFRIKGEQRYKPLDYTIEGDWSAAAFLAVAGAVGGEVIFNNINTSSAQADIKILEALRLAGAIIIMEENSVKVIRNGLKAFDFDATECPDLFPPLVSLAANCNGTSAIKGVHRLAHKESSRAKVLKTEFGKLGIEIFIEGDIMKIIGGPIYGGEITSHNDHRIAMAAACMAINAESDVLINEAECVSKSYPNFFNDFRLLGLS